MSNATLAVLPPLVGAFMVARALYTGDPSEQLLALWGALCCMIIFAGAQVSALVTAVQMAKYRAEAAAMLRDTGEEPEPGAEPSEH